MLYRFGLFLTGDAELARELAQETARVALSKDWPEGLGADAPGDSAGKWLRAILHNLLRNERRKESRSRLLFDTEIVRAAEDRFVSSPALGDDSWRASRTALGRCLDGLPLDQRDIVRSRYERGDAVNDMAARLGLDVNAVSKRLERLRRALRECVKRRLREEAHD